jgi:hypothetical protein
MSQEILHCMPVRSAAESFDKHATRLIQFYLKDLRNESERKAFAGNLETGVYLGLSPKFKNSTISAAITAGKKLSSDQEQLFSKLAENTKPFLSKRSVCG